MTSSAGITNCQANTYQQHSNGLLFQFILVEFIEVYTAIQRLETIFHRKPTQLDKDDCCSGHFNAHRQEVQELLTKLIGAPRSYMRLFSWNFGEGLLSKMKTNCVLLLNHTDSNEKELIALQHYAEKVWLGCAAAAEALRDSMSDKGALINAIDKTSNAMQRFAKLIARLPNFFRDDENVIFCILCHKESLDRLFGHRFVAKLLSKMYPGGLAELRAIMTKKYEERGFTHILPAIATKCAELEVSSL